MKILAIETSCDETGIAVIEASDNKNPEVLANLVRSQIDIHAPYGGVVPNIAKREHQKALPLLLDEIKKQGLDNNINLVAVTQGPGLSPCLWQGVEFAKKLAGDLGVGLVGVNHLKGHIYIAFPYEEVEYPVLSLIVSGGHTELVWSRSPGEFKILGKTRDDAAGEAFDKVARMLGLGFPGGPEISRVSKDGNPEQFDLPRPMIKTNDFDFSFAGLKTAVVYLVRGVGPQEKPIELNKKNIADLAASFQRAVVDVLVEKTVRAGRKLNPKTIILGGGVAANELLRRELEKNVAKRLPGTKLILPDKKLTGDNALMIALAAWYERGRLQPQKDLKALPNLKIDEK